MRGFKVFISIIFRWFQQSLTGAYRGLTGVLRRFERFQRVSWGIYQSTKVSGGFRGFSRHFSGFQGRHWASGELIGSLQWFQGGFITGVKEFEAISKGFSNFLVNFTGVSGEVI